MTNLLEVPFVRENFRRFDFGLFESDDEFDQAKDVLEVLGILGLVKYLKQKRFNQGDYPIRYESPKLREPLEVSSALCDILNLKEIIIDGAYSLHPELEAKVQGLPIIDIGAFVGISTTYFASLFPDSRVIAVEPQTRNYQKLIRNTFPYRDQIFTIKAALQSNFGRSDILESRNRHPYMPLFVAKNSSDLVSQEVVTNVTPDTLLNSGLIDGSDIGILKIDIEGAERDIFTSGAINHLLYRSNILMVETHDQFVPGCSEAVNQVAMACDLELIGQNPHSISVYSRI